MYQLTFILLIILNIYLLKDNKKIIKKSYMPLSYKICLIGLFLVLVVITRKYAKNKLAISFLLLIFLLFYNSLVGGLKEDGIAVFSSGQFPIRMKIPYKEIGKIDKKTKKDYILLSISAYSNYYYQYFSLKDKKEVVDFLKEKNIQIEKSKSSSI